MVEFRKKKKLELQASGKIQNSHQRKTSFHKHCKDLSNRKIATKIAKIIEMHLLKTFYVQSKLLHYSQKVKSHKNKYKCYDTQRWVPSTD